MNNNTIKQILSLNDESLKELKNIYARLYCQKTTLTSKQQLIQKIAYRMQELEYGFLSDKHSKKLAKLTDDLEKGKLFADNKCFKPTRGTIIKKSHNGNEYEVEAVESGFIFEGQQYKSLSAIARKITGTRWNGLRFFGIRKK